MLDFEAVVILVSLAVLVSGPCVLLVPAILSRASLSLVGLERHLGVGLLDWATLVRVQAV